MKDEDKDKEQLLQDLLGMRKHTAELESELSKMKKFESMGTQASGMAHEFNNILTAIIGNLVLLKMYVRPESEVFDILSEAEKASLRAENLTRQLLSVSSGKPLANKRVSIREMVLGLPGAFSNDTAVKFEISAPAGILPVEAEEGQIRHALMTLMVNARQSMPSGGIITIGVENVTHDKVSSLPLKEGQYVKVSVEDHGAGIERENIEKIFDPFFYTKESSSRRGLISSYSIISSHKGYIDVVSGVGSGTTFTVYLPAAVDTIETDDDKKGASTSVRKKILVMDDEEIVRNVIDRMLNQCGCSTVFACEGSEMLNIYRQAMEAGKPFDAVIIDLVVSSGMGGKEAIGKLLEMDPKAKAIVSSGCSEDQMITDFSKFGFVEVLAKPYQISELNRVLQKIVAGGKE